jgi:hypothetical protein
MTSLPETWKIPVAFFNAALIQASARSSESVGDLN